MPLSASTPALSHSTYSSHQSASDGISVTVPDLFVINVGLFGAIPLSKNLEILNTILIPRAKTSKVWQTLTTPGGN
jgi:hypothetical protein